MPCQRRSLRHRRSSSETKCRLPAPPFCLSLVEMFIRHHREEFGKIGTRHELLEQARGETLGWDQLMDDLLNQALGHHTTIRQSCPMMHPLPHLRARDLRGCRVFHEVVDRHAARAAEPTLEVLDADV